MRRFIIGIDNLNVTFSAPSALNVISGVVAFRHEYLNCTPATPDLPITDFPWLTVLIIVVFGVMGLRLPTHKFTHKVVYTAVVLGIVFLPAVVSNYIRFIPMLGLIAVIHSCQMFKLWGRLIVAGLVYVSYLYIIIIRSQSMIFVRIPIGQPKPIAEQIATNTANLILNNAISFALTLAFVVLLVNAVLSERRSRQELAIATNNSVNTL